MIECSSKHTHTHTHTHTYTRTHTHTYTHTHTHTYTRTHTHVRTHTHTHNYTRRDTRSSKCQKAAESRGAVDGGGLDGPSLAALRAWHCAGLTKSRSSCGQTFTGALLRANATPSHERSSSRGSRFRTRIATRYQILSSSRGSLIRTKIATRYHAFVARWHGSLRRGGKKQKQARRAPRGGHRKQQRFR